MRKFFEAYNKFMYGRYGQDELGKALVILYLIVMVLNLVFRRITLVFWGIEVVILILWALRYFSRQIYKRQQENQKYLKFTGGIKSYFNYLKLAHIEKKGVNRLFRCPKCHQIIRVPKGRGKIAIKCPKCSFQFIKRT
ncbi:MAG: hypothetical protein K6G63_02815 [Eubacterium sp.]|nr:hypothetical protein [Eubacterium sp.]